ncbi:universal stress protein [Methylophaga lonarensis]|uniref:universal stress protein n=1 Tax=Methylophaga lonarensis TaxID=999151 RepID=UPI003D2A2FCB
MAHYQHILIAADFSEHNERVLEQAAMLAREHNAQLSICHIVEDYPLTDFAYEPMVSVDSEMREMLLEAGKKQVAALADKLNISEAQQWVEFGNPRHDIVKIANERQVDLIVLGSHGRHGWRLLLGSTANAVLHHSECDVLAVRLKKG